MVEEYVIRARERAAEAAKTIETLGGADQALTFADEVVKDILADEEKYQDVIKDLSTDAIRGTMRKLEVTSEEFRAGADILGERAYGYLYQATDEVMDEIYEEFSEGIIPVTPPPVGVDDEVDTSLFDTNTRMTDALLNAAQDIADKADLIRVNNDSILDKIGSWLSDTTSALSDTLFGWLPDLASDAITGLFALPARILFESFKSFFFEETE